MELSLDCHLERWKYVPQDGMEFLDVSLSTVCDYSGGSHHSGIFASAF